MDYSYMYDLQDGIKDERRRLAKAKAMLKSYEHGELYDIETLKKYQGYVMWRNWQYNETPTPDDLNPIDTVVYRWLIKNGYTVTFQKRYMYGIWVAENAWSRIILSKVDAYGTDLSAVMLTVPGTEINVCDDVWVMVYTGPTVPPARDSGSDDELGEDSADDSETESI